MPGTSSARAAPTTHGSCRDTPEQDIRPGCNEEFGPAARSEAGQRHRAGPFPLLTGAFDPNPHPLAAPRCTRPRDPASRRPQESARVDALDLNLSAHSPRPRVEMPRAQHRAGKNRPRTPAFVGIGCTTTRDGRARRLTAQLPNAVRFTAKTTAITTNRARPVVVLCSSHSANARSPTRWTNRASPK